jgi:hypothetical protein
VGGASPVLSPAIRGGVWLGFEFRCRLVTFGEGSLFVSVIWDIWGDGEAYWCGGVGHNSRQSHSFIHDMFVAVGGGFYWFTTVWRR